MRILWVKAGPLWPLTSGGRIRSFHIVSELSRSHEVTLVTVHARSKDAGELRAQLPRCSHVASFAYDPLQPRSARFFGDLARSWLSPLPLELRRSRIPAVRHAVAELLAAGEFDVCIADFLFAMPNLPASLSTPVVLFEHNVEHVLWENRFQAAPVWQRPVARLESRKLRRYERRACAAATLTLAVSEPDRAQLAAAAPGAAVSAIPTGVDAAYFAPALGREQAAQLVFVGALDWYPNHDAMVHFIDEILPLIRAEIPETSMTIVGRNPSEGLRSRATEAGIQVTGTVDDVRPHVADATVLVVPIRVGSGTRLKIFEGLAMAKAVVSSTIGAQGLPLVAGEHFLQSDDPADFARQVVLLLRDPARRMALGQAGRELVAGRFSWAQVTREFEARCRDALAVSVAPPRFDDRG